MSKTLKFYNDLLSQPGRAMLIFLNVTKIPFENLPVDLRKGEQLTKEFKEVNRFKKVPCMDDNGFKLSESVAMVRYLAKKHNVPENWYPKDEKKQALVDEYLEWQHSNTRLSCTTLFQLLWLKPLQTEKKSDPEAVAEQKKRVEDTLDAIENLWLDKTPFLVGNEISVADIWGACEIEQLVLTHFDFRKGRPKLSAWMDKVRSATNPHYDEAHKKIKQISETAEP